MPAKPQPVPFPWREKPGSILFDGAGGAPGITFSPATGNNLNFQWGTVAAWVRKRTDGALLPIFEVERLDGGDDDQWFGFNSGNNLDWWMTSNGNGYSGTTVTVSDGITFVASTKTNGNPSTPVAYIYKEAAKSFSTGNYAGGFDNSSQPQTPLRIGYGHFGDENDGEIMAVGAWPQKVFSLNEIRSLIFKGNWEYNFPGGWYWDANDPLNLKGYLRGIRGTARGALTRGNSGPRTSTPFPRYTTLPMYANTGGAPPPTGKAYWGTRIA